MLFTSYEFIGFFLAVFILYYLLPKKAQWPLLLVASYVFYFIAGADYLVYILTTTVTVYAGGLVLGSSNAKQSQYLKEHKKDLSREEKKAYKEVCKAKRYRVVALIVLLNLGILAVLKYSNFMINNVNGIIDFFAGKGSGTLNLVDFVLPMGISFYTFRAIGYIIDVNRGTVEAEHNFFKFALYVSFFPLVVQGPITDYTKLTTTLFNEHKWNWQQVSFGLQRILWGFFKKVVIADRILTAVTTMISDVETYTGAYAFVIMMFYTVELYADFTGGIDITIGIGQALGIAIEENFDHPFASTSLKEYWRRWHITMSDWFKTYLFYPISVSKTMQNLNKFCRAKIGNNVGKKVPVYLASFIVWFATGIWHGSSWNFITWGLLNWLILMVSEELEPAYDKFHNKFSWSNGKIYHGFMVVRTFLIISALKIFDCYTDVGVIFKQIGSIFTASNWNILWNGDLLALGLTLADYIVLAVAVVLMSVVSGLGFNCSLREKIAAKPYPVQFALWFGLFLIVIIFGAYGIGYDSSQFIYNRF